MRGLLKPGQKLGEYTLDHWLGAGGMSEVWLARKDRDPGLYVVKRLHDHLAHDQRQIDRFIDEADLAHRLVHPNLARVHGVSNSAGIWFLVMDFVDGVELKQALHVEPGPMKPALAAHFAAQAAIGLAYAQSKKDSKGRTLNFVHRDIAPDNVMVDVEGHVKVVDFGIARMLDTEVTTQTGLRKGKLRYMAREYLRDHVFDASTDVYALGCTLYELVTGARPFHGFTNQMALMEEILMRELPRASELRPSLPKELVEIIFDATRALPKKRIQNAAELAKRLVAFGAGYPPPAQPEVAKLVKHWQQLAATKDKQRQPVGVYGQLETTEAVQSGPPELKKRKKVSDGLPSTSVQVAGKLDATEAVTAPYLKGYEDDRPTMRVPAYKDAPPSVIVSPQLTLEEDEDDETTLPRQNPRRKK